MRPRLGFAALGVCLGGGLALLLWQPRPVLVSCALEAAVHDIPLAQGVLLASFPHFSAAEAADAAASVFVYGLTQLLTAVCFVALQRRRPAEPPCGFDELAEPVPPRVDPELD